MPQETDTHPTDTSEELREILADEMAKRGHPITAKTIREKRYDEEWDVPITVALAAMSRVTTTHAGEGMAGANRLQAIIAELKSFPPSLLLEDAIDSLERIS